MKEWVDPPITDVSAALRAAIGGHPLVAQTLVRRGFPDVLSARAFLDPDHYVPAPPHDLPNLGKAVERLEKAISDKETICVWGDFDADGQTATTLLVSALQGLGAISRFYIPHRQRESHGVHIDSLERLIREGVELLLTCDTGVTAHKAIDHAQSLGVDVVVTDHHDLPPVLPGAYAVVNPKMLPTTHPLRELPGVGCAYKLAEGLYERAERAEDVLPYLDLVALGIVADVAVQVRDTRYLLQRGLEQLRHTERLGLRVLMEKANLDPMSLTEEHIGFELGPRLNALGRLADANVAVELLTTQDLIRARTLATQLEGLNAQRKLLVKQITQAAEAQLERDPLLLEYSALVLDHSSWPAGILGIVASRLAERYGRPAILIASPEGSVSRGSARSIAGCNITAAIAAHQEMLHSFGGHPMAAGVALDPERIPAFREALSETVKAIISEIEEPTLQIDGYLSLADLTPDLVREIERLAPFGAGNPPLTLVTRDLRISSARVIGRGKEHLLLTLEDDAGGSQEVVWWQGAGAPRPQGRFDLAYTARSSDYRGEPEVQLQWVDARLTEEMVVPVRSPAIPVQVVDYRQEPGPLRRLSRLRDLEEDVQVWAEAAHKSQVGGQDRLELEPSKRLAVWTIPPSHGVLKAVMEQVAPETVYLFAVDPPHGYVQGFLARLAGLVKHSLASRGGRVRVARLAAATAQQEKAVRAGLDWLRDQGHFTVLHEEADEMLLLTGAGQLPKGASTSTSRLESLLGETRAFRAYFRRAGEEEILSLLMDW